MGAGPVGWDLHGKTLSNQDKDVLQRAMWCKIIAHHIWTTHPSTHTVIVYIDGQVVHKSYMKSTKRLDHI